ncbi:hypothetical protein B0T09DRAFT_342894 [Sordaria sp. MPI-SDFR-AT-0083]|nr:hypothetical protein B0T09DRAFT_342894 [Sordaria sp. MPI-SDFR-AT-0083]
MCAFIHALVWSVLALSLFLTFLPFLQLLARTFFGTPFSGVLSSLPLTNRGLGGFPFSSGAPRQTQTLQWEKVEVSTRRKCLAQFIS